MTFIISILSLALFAQTSLSPMTVGQAEQFLTKPMTPELKATVESTPKEYSFFNHDNRNSVVYSGQIMRQVLMSDLATVME